MTDIYDDDDPRPNEDEGESYDAGDDTEGGE